MAGNLVYANVFFLALFLYNTSVVLNGRFSLRDFLMIDYIIIGIIAFSILVSLLRGFVREVLSLGSWVVAFIVASQFYPYLAAYLTQIESMYIGRHSKLCD